MNKSIISVKHVSKAVDDRQLLSDVTFDIEEQSLVSLIGPNGAGTVSYTHLTLPTMFEV